jgi:ribosomal protein S18 acetylase RimI-like enzyme
MGMSDLGLRPMVAGDRPAIERIVAEVAVFSAGEVETALELVDEWLEEGEASGYLTYVIEEEDPIAVRGYVCFGPTPLTESTWDLYWVAVDPRAQGRGYGQKLLAFAEAEVRRRGGRLLLIETASQEAYGATVRFYERAGYELVSRIRDFYREGDDKLTFAKVIPV